MQVGIERVLESLFHLNFIYIFIYVRKWLMQGDLVSSKSVVQAGRLETRAGFLC